MKTTNMLKLGSFKTEYDMTCAAQDGDKKAWMALYTHYKPMMMSRLLVVKGLARNELESEACEVFAHKLDLFDRSKVKSQDAFSMFICLFRGIVNRTNKVIRQRKRDTHLYFDNVDANSLGNNLLEDKFTLKFEDEYADLGSFQSRMLTRNDDLYNAYNPERIVIEDLRENDTERVKSFYAKLTQFEKNILEARREGFTLIEVAKKFHCSVTTVKNHIRKAKNYANDIFQVCYA